MMAKLDPIRLKANALMVQAISLLDVVGEDMAAIYVQEAIDRLHRMPPCSVADLLLPTINTDENDDRPTEH